MTTLSSLNAHRLAQAKWAFSTRRVEREDAVSLLNTLGEAASGDLVLGRIERIGSHKRIQLAEGRASNLYVGDLVVLACGDRYAPDQFEGLGGAGSEAGCRHAGRRRRARPHAAAPCPHVAADAASCPLGTAEPTPPEVTSSTSPATRWMAAPRPDSLTVIGVVGASMNSGKDHGGHGQPGPRPEPGRPSGRRDQGHRHRALSATTMPSSIPAHALRRRLHGCGHGVDLSSAPGPDRIRPGYAAVPMRRGRGCGSRRGRAGRRGVPERDRRSLAQDAAHPRRLRRRDVRRSRRPGGRRWLHGAARHWASSRPFMTGMVSCSPLGAAEAESRDRRATSSPGMRICATRRRPTRCWRKSVGPWSTGSSVRPGGLARIRRRRHDPAAPCRRRRSRPEHRSGRGPRPRPGGGRRHRRLRHARRLRRPARPAPMALPIAALMALVAACRPRDRRVPRRSSGWWPSAWARTTPLPCASSSSPISHEMSARDVAQRRSGALAMRFVGDLASPYAAGSASASPG